MDAELKKHEIAILDNCEIESLRILQKEGFKLEGILSIYDEILITGWVWNEVCDSQLRKKFVESLIQMGYPIRIVYEQQFKEIETRELVLLELFEMVIRPYSQLRSYFNRHILKGKEKIEIEFLFEEWIEKVFIEWPFSGTIIRSGSGDMRAIKKNAGEISIVYLASILLYQSENDLELTIWTRDADCHFCMEELAKETERRGINIHHSFKNLSVVLKEAWKDELLEETKLDVLLGKFNGRRMIYCYKKEDNSVELRRKNVAKDELKELIKNDKVEIIW